MEDVEVAVKSPYQRFVDGLRELRSWDDQQPETFIYGEGKNMYRKNWWGVLTNRLYIGLNKGYIPEELREEVEEFYNHYISDDFKGKTLTEPQDVERAKELLDKILSELPSNSESKQ